MWGYCIVPSLEERTISGPQFTGTFRISIQIFIDIFGAQRIAALIADREFIGKAWVDYLIKNKIPFFIRIKENRLVKWGEEMRHIAVFFQHLKVKQKRHIQFNLDGHLLFFAGIRSKKGELVIVM
jgi:hypothetical protein